MQDQNRKGRWFFVLDERTRILFVDDDPILCEFAKVHLASPAATVDSAPDGEAAWTRLCEGPFDVALIDIEMPRLDGFGLVERIRADARFEYLPVVMLTGRDDVVSIDRSYDLGATSFVTKPVPTGASSPTRCVTSCAPAGWKPKCAAPATAPRSSRRSRATSCP